MYPGTAPGKFSTSIPGLIIDWHSHTMSLWKTCPRRYKFEIIDGWKSKDEAAALSWGEAFHKGMEVYDRIMAAGGETHDALRQAIRAVLGVARSWTFTDPYRSRENLALALVWYTDHFMADGIETVIMADGRPAIEIDFTINTDVAASSGEPFTLSGRIDKIGRFAGLIYLIDRKHTKSALSSYYFARYSPDNQISFYDFAGQSILPEPISGVLIDALELKQNFVRFGRGFAPRTSAQREEWYSELRYFLRQASDFISAGFFPANDTSCAKYGGCPFQGICSKDPAVRETFLRADFVQGQAAPKLLPKTTATEQQGTTPNAQS